jgi:hypothetical protein
LRGLDPAALQAGQGKHVVGLGKVGLLIDHIHQVLNHVRNALDWLSVYLGSAKFHQRQIIMCPGIAVVELACSDEFLAGFVELSSLHADPAQGAVRDRVVPLGVGDDGLKVLLSLIAMFGQAHRHFRNQRLRLGLDYIHHTGPDIERAQGSRKLVYLTSRSACACLGVGLGLRG